MPNFNEATRVQIPALVHLSRLGYSYFGKIEQNDAGVLYDADTNILLEVFKKQFYRLNPGFKGSFDALFIDIKNELDNDDLGRSFFKRLQSLTPRLIDFEDVRNNTFHYTAEFTCKNGGEEFRPDITLFINGLGLIFIEVKRPNNDGGMRAEARRLNEVRFPNKKFRRFLNLTQFMIFSNNKEYFSAGGVVPVEGAFYSTISRSEAFFNSFKEENKNNLKIAPFIKDYPYLEKDDAVEKKILADFNCQVLKNTKEYQTNLDFNTPTNRI